jgi:uncharacterized protein YecE (DUF72 family)
MKHCGVAMSVHSHIHIGTSGWVYPHWKKVFYPAGLPEHAWLQYYAQHLDSTEINASFYRLPSRTTVLGWQQKAGPEFCFCPKMSRFVTHAKKLNDPEQSVPRFFEVFDAIATQVGPVLIQLPPMLKFREEKAAYFFTYLRTHYPGYRFALEARHASWTTPDAADLLQKNGIAWVIADSGTRFASAEFITAPHIYLRFHGPDGSYATPYTKRTLSIIARKCRGWIDARHEVWAFFNNDLHGYAIRNTLSLKELLLSI